MHTYNSILLLFFFCVTYVCNNNSSCNNGNKEKATKYFVERDSLNNIISEGLVYHKALTDSFFFIDTLLRQCVVINTKHTKTGIWRYYCCGKKIVAEEKYDVDGLRIETLIYDSSKYKKSDGYIYDTSYTSIVFDPILR